MNLALDATTVNGPSTLTIVAGKTLSTNGTQFNCPVVNNGTLIQVAGGVGPDVFNGGLTNSADSTFRLQATAGGNVTATFATSFTNNGTLILDGNSTTNSVEVFVNGGTLTNGPGGSIISTGGFGPHRLRFFAGNGFVNQGTVTLSGANLNLVNSGVTATAFTNSGTIAVGAGATFASDFSLTNAVGGMLTGAGTVAGNVANAGTLSPGSSPGLLTVNGNYSQTGTLAMELNGIAAGTGYDQLKVNGTVSLGGLLSLTALATPPVGTPFTLIDNDGTDIVTGTFTGLPQGMTLTAGGTTYSISYTGGTGNDVVLTSTAAGPPRVVGAPQVNGGSAQRSMVTSISVAFSTIVGLPANAAAAFTLARIGGGLVTIASATAQAVSGATVVTLTGFSGAEASMGGSLNDGRYMLTALASQITANGQQLDGDGNGTTGDNFVFADSGAATGNQLYRFFGDITGDRFVNGADFALFRTAFGTQSSDPNYNAAFDVNGDGFVNGADFAPFRTNFGGGI